MSSLTRSLDLEQQIPRAFGDKYVRGFGLVSVLIGLVLPLMANAIDYRDSNLTQYQKASTDAHYPPAFGPYKPHPAQGVRGQSNRGSNSASTRDSKRLWDSSMMPYRPVSKDSNPAARYSSRHSNQQARVTYRDSNDTSRQRNAQSSSKRYRPWDAEPMALDATSTSRGPFSYRPEVRQSSRSQAQPKPATRSQQTTATNPVHQGNTTPSWSYGPSSDPGERYWGPQANSMQAAPNTSFARVPQTGYQRQYSNKNSAHRERYSGPYRGQSSTWGSAPAYSAAGSRWWGASPNSTGMNAGRSRGYALERASPPVGIDAGQYYWGTR